MSSVVVIIPGIMGSVLELNDEIIWPGPVTRLIFPYNKMEELLSDDLVPTDCIRNYFITNQYQQLIDDLNTCGFYENDKTLIIAAYDWRKDNANSAQTIAQHIDNAVAHHGADTDISIIAHSMGGLVSRYYLESGYFNTRLGFNHISRLITLGTPHRGAAITLPLVLGYEKRLFLNKEQVLQVVSDPRYPAAYQLLPMKGEPIVWDGSVGKQFNPLDIYDPSIADKLGLLQANLKSTQQFHSSLDFTKRPTHVRYFCFAGTRQTTTTHILLRPRSSGRFEPMKIEQEDGGDGTVPIWSSFLNGLQRMFVGGEHSTIYHNLSLRRTLATVLGKEGYLAGVPEKVEVAIREKVVEPKDLVYVAITFGTGIQGFSGVITIERVQLNQATGKVEGFDTLAQVHPIEYKGLGLETMSLVFEAPNIRGVYRVAIRNDVKATPSGYDELVVQEPLNP